jgi:hypothetical protein
MNKINVPHIVTLVVCDYGFSHVLLCLPDMLSYCECRVPWVDPSLAVTVVVTVQLLWYSQVGNQSIHRRHRLIADDDVGFWPLREISVAITKYRFLWSLWRKGPASFIIIVENDTASLRLNACSTAVSGIQSSSVWFRFCWTVSWSCDIPLTNIGVMYAIMQLLCS